MELNSGTFFEWAYKNNEENSFFFKSNQDDLFFVAYGEPEKTGLNSTIFPKVFIGNFEGKHSVYTYPNWIMRSGNEISSKTSRLIKLKKETNQTTELGTKIYLDTKDDFKNFVQNALEKIIDKSFKKIVISRRMKYLANPINQNELIKKLILKNQLAQNTYFILYTNKNNISLSFSPETFIRQKGMEISSMALAGSVPNSHVPEFASKNEDKIINDNKLILEHDLVVEDVNSVLKEYLNEVSISPLSILKLPYIMHRKIDFSGNLKKDVSMIDLITALHPTPALGTLPREGGAKVIYEIEKTERDLYGAPIGIITESLSDLAVNLRMIEITNDCVSARVGCGIVLGSNPSLEWEETENKFSPFERVLNEI
jgi:menaquinone-specific isochorismate synthase